MRTLTVDDVDTTVEKARKKYEDIVQRRKDAHSQIESLQQALSDGEERLVGLRAEQILNGRSGDERFEALSATLANQRDELRALESERKALAVAEREAGRALQAAETRAKRQAAERLLDQIRQTARKLDGILSQAERVNDQLIQLDAAAKAEGLAEVGVGGKTLLLLARTGCGWPALDADHKGYVTTVRGWRESVVALLNEE
jgi:chromosome segregation ATPase